MADDLKATERGRSPPEAWQDAVSRGKDEIHDALRAAAFATLGRAHRLRRVLARRDWQRRNPNAFACRPKGFDYCVALDDLAFGFPVSGASPFLLLPPCSRRHLKCSP